MEGRKSGGNVPLKVHFLHPLDEELLIHGS
jgi:hypothetical protein